MAKTGAEKYFDKQMRDPEFAAEYRAARAEIDAVDNVLRAIDGARAELGMSKRTLAARGRKSPAAVRKLFTVENPNPSFGTVAVLAKEVGYQLKLVKIKAVPKSSKHKRPSKSRRDEAQP